MKAALVIGLVVLVSVPGPSEADIVTLPPHTAWCTDVVIAEGTDRVRYSAALAEAVSAIDQTLGRGASTGTPFVAASKKRTPSLQGSKPPDSDPKEVEVTVCAVVPANAGIPTKDSVRRVERGGEVVYAGRCPIAEADACFDKVRSDALTALKGTPHEPSLEGAFWWSVRSAHDATDAAGLTAALVASDTRRVTLPPTVASTGDLQSAAALSTPIEQQVERPLILKRPGWFDVIAAPTDAWIIVAIPLPSVAAAEEVPRLGRTADQRQRLY